MKRDIETRSDIEQLLREFYSEAVVDKQIGHHFDDLDLEAHLPVIIDFWEKVLFGKPVYFNNPLTVHQKLHEKFRLKVEHFVRWVEIFCRIVDELFEGETAEAAKLRAKTIAHSLNQKLNNGIEIQKST